MTNRELLERIVALNKLASTDETRYHLCGVHISVDDGECVLKVTDGHKASEERVMLDETVLDIPKEGWLIPSDSVKSIAGFLKTLGRHEPCEVKLEGNRMVLMSMNSRSELKIEEVIYPDFRSLWPRCESKMIIGLNAEYLLEISKALRDRPKNTTVKLEIIDANSAITISVGDRKAVLMPVRV